MHAQLIKCNKILIVCNLSYSNFYQNHDYAVSFFYIFQDLSQLQTVVGLGLGLRVRFIGYCLSKYWKYLYHFLTAFIKGFSVFPIQPNAGLDVVMVRSQFH